MMPNPIRCMVVDDEDLALALLEAYIRQTPSLQLAASCENAVQAAEILKQEPVDLIFLDIQMPYLTGLEFLEKNPDRPPVILTTSYADFALEGFRLQVLDYLLKPFSPDRFRQAVEKAAEFITFRQAYQAQHETSKLDYIFVKSDYKMVRIRLSDILYVEGLKQYLKIFTTEKMIITLDSFHHLESLLPAEHFVRIHKSFLVAVAQITALKTNTVEIGKKLLPVGRAYKTALLSLKRDPSQ